MAVCLLYACFTSPLPLPLLLLLLLLPLHILLPIARGHHQRLAPVRWQFPALATGDSSPAR
jgi:hypothetical protein